jgi:hypothetical protein
MSKVAGFAERIREKTANSMSRDIATATRIDSGTAMNQPSCHVKMRQYADAVMISACAKFANRMTPKTNPIDKAASPRVAPAERASTSD